MLKDSSFEIVRDNSIEGIVRVVRKNVDVHLFRHIYETLEGRFLTKIYPKILFEMTFFCNLKQ